MKKMYNIPRTEVIQLLSENTIMAGSPTGGAHFESIHDDAANAI